MADSGRRGVPRAKRGLAGEPRGAGFLRDKSRVQCFVLAILYLGTRCPTTAMPGSGRGTYQPLSRVIYDYVNPSSTSVMFCWPMDSASTAPVSAPSVLGLAADMFDGAKDTPTEYRYAYSIRKSMPLPWLTNLLWIGPGGLPRGQRRSTPHKPHQAR